MTTQHRREAILESSVTLDHPAASVGALLLDWGNDHLWRTHVRRVTCTPAGRAMEGQELVEELRFAGLTFVTPTVVESAGLLGATYTGGSSAISVTGTRNVVANATGGCVVHVITRLRVHGWLRLLAPLLVPAYRRTQDADLEQLARWIDGVDTPAATAVSS
jgi:hypothetical protein